MSRSNFKAPFLNKKLQKKKIIKTRNSIILPEDANKNIFVYTGKNYFCLKVNENMIGFKFGEFIRTRAIYKPKTKK